MTVSSPITSGAESLTVNIQTLGCKVNSFESEYIYDRMQSGKFARSSDSQGDVCIINTCTVTREADRQSRQTIRRAVKHNPNSVIVVTGCYAEMNPRECAQIDGVDLVVPGSEKLEILQYISNFLSEKPDLIHAGKNEFRQLPDEPVVAFKERSRAFVQVQQGCDNGCTFCIIHKARGPSRSILPTTINRQVSLHVSSGFREIVLCGIDLGDYGADLPGADETKVTLADLTRELASRYRHCRFRLSSIDPVHITSQLVEVIGEMDNVCPHVHLSLQSGSSIILKRMKRRYGPKDVYQAVDSLRSARPEMVLSADVMAGFPTESEADFKETCNMIRDLEIAYPHVFAYSQRDGTPAARIPKQIDPKVRKTRAKRLRELGQSVRRDVLKRFAGKRCQVLFEHYLENVNMTKARMSNFVPVYIPGNIEMNQDMAFVRTEQLCLDGLLGRMDDWES